MLLKRWEPFVEIARVERDMDRLWGRLVHPHRLWPRFRIEDRHDGHIEVDVYHDDDNLVVKASIPGIKPDDLELNITDDVLAIKGELNTDREMKEEDFLRRERRYGTFRRLVRLPSSLNTDKAESTYEGGVLTITISKEETAKPKPLKVKVIGR